MFVPKGYRAREAAARLRNHRKLAPDAVRAQRLQFLPDNVVTNSYNIEPEVVASVQTPAEKAPEVVEVEKVAVEAVVENASDEVKPKKTHKNKAK